MTLRTAAHTAGSVEGAADARLDAVALWALQGPGPLDVRTGVVYAPGNPMQVLGTSATSPWAVTVNPGHVVTKKSGVSNGVYYSANDALVTVALAVPPATNSRIDTIYAMQLDAAALVDVDGSTAATLAAVTGTSGNGGLGATPTVPAVPVGAVALYSVQILSTATAGTSGAGVTITRLFLWTVPRGVPIPVLSQAERDAITAYETLKVDRLDLHRGEFYDGTAWTDPRSGFMYGTEYDPGSATTNTMGGPNVDTLVGTGVTFTLARIRRVRIVTRCRFFSSTGSQIVYLRSAVIAGSTAVVAGSTLLGQASQTLTAAGATTAATGVTTTHEQSVALNPGTYTAFPIGGSTTGATSSFVDPYTAVYDAGTA